MFFTFQQVSKICPFFSIFCPFFNSHSVDLNLVHYNEKLYCSVPKTAQNFNVLNHNLMFFTFQQVSKFCQFFSIFLSIFQLPLRRSTDPLLASSDRQSVANVCPKPKFIGIINNGN